MAGDYYDEPLDYPEKEARSRDAKTDEAKAALRTYFDANPAKVFYERQLVVMFVQARRPRPYFTGEGFFHWIAVRALVELVEEGRIRARTLPLGEPVTDVAIRGEEEVLRGPGIRFFWSKRARYVARQAEAIRRLVTQFSATNFGRALGQQGETMFDAALPTKGLEFPQLQFVRILPVDVRAQLNRAEPQLVHDAAQFPNGFPRVLHRKDRRADKPALGSTTSKNARISYRCPMARPSSRPLREADACELKSLERHCRNLPGTLAPHPVRVRPERPEDRGTDVDKPRPIVRGQRFLRCTQCTVCRMSFRTVCSRRAWREKKSDRDSLSSW